jgi:predicted metalloprotease
VVRPEVTFASILNRFEFNSDVIEKGQYTGTLFWFPLRQQESSLSSTVYSEEKAKFLFSSFIKEASYNLLFLRDLERIEVYNLENYLPYYTLEMCGLRNQKSVPVYCPFSSTLLLNSNLFRMLAKVTSGQ